MSKDVRDLSRRRVLFGGVAVGSAALLAACTSNEQTPTNTQTKGPDSGANPNSAAGKAITIGFSAPAADHGWIAAITNNAKAQAADLTRQARAALARNDLTTAQTLANQAMNLTADNQPYPNA